MAQIRTQMEQTESSYDKEKFSERLAKLVGGVAIIRVGAATEAEMKQTKGRVEDALHATRAAVAEGIVPAAGRPCCGASRSSRSWPRSSRATRRSGPRSWPAPSRSRPHDRRELRRGRGGDRRRGATRGEKNLNIGYNANTGEYVDMFKAGIIDPTVVTRSALQNAASIAGLMLTTEVMVTKIDEDDKKSKVAGSIA